MLILKLDKVHELKFDKTYIFNIRNSFVALFVYMFVLSDFRISRLQLDVFPLTLFLILLVCANVKGYKD